MNNLEQENNRLKQIKSKRKVSNAFRQETFRGLMAKIINERQSQENDTDYFILVLIIVVAIALYNYHLNLQGVKNYFIELRASSLVYFVVLVIFIILFSISYIFYKSAKFVSYKIAYLKDKSRLIQKEINDIENLLLKVFVIDEQELIKDIEELRNKISICRHYKKLNCFIPQLKKRLAKARELLEETRKKQFSRDLSEQIQQKTITKKNLDKEIKDKEYERLCQEEKNKKAILRKLNVEDNYVFEKDNLNKKEVEILLQNGYSIFSEYCIIKKKLINVLIKKKLNHTPTHIFLVWNTKNLLRKIKGVKDVKEHLSVDADLTFKFQGKTHALEIETGTLIGKTKQKEEKVKYLNRKYQDGWMFIVSNRNLMKKYNKLGLATQRKGVSENLAKMIKIAQPIQEV